MAVDNQDEVERFRRRAFAKHGCVGWWKDEYRYMSLDAMCQELQLRKVIRQLRKDGF